MKNKTTNASYADYLKDQLMVLSSNFSIKAYKRANEEDWIGFEKGRDLRIQIQWKKECIWEWITEKTLWVQRNTNKEDRIWMQRHADTKINACKNALVKKKTDTHIPKTKMALKEKTKIGNTQDLFENMKKS